MLQALANGTTVALIAPSGPVAGEKHALAVENLLSLGLKVKEGKFWRGEAGFFSGTDAERLEDLNAAIRDPDVRLIVCARGGYGAMRLLEGIDWEAWRLDPKPILGYSDITALHCAGYARLGIPGWHGAIPAGNWSDFERCSLQAALFGDATYDVFASGDRAPSSALADANGTARLNAGNSVQGPLLGGNLCMLASLCGTPYLPNFDGSILLLEDVGEYPYRIDRFLVQLELAGVFKNVRAVLVGKFEGCGSAKGDEKLPSVEAVLRDRLDRLPVPVIHNVDFGHLPEKITWPFGAQVELKLATVPELWFSRG